METAKSISLPLEALTCTSSGFHSARLTQECHRPFQFTSFNCGSVEGELCDKTGKEKRWKLEQHFPLYILKVIKAQTFHTIVFSSNVESPFESPRFAFVEHLGTGELLRTRLVPRDGLQEGA